MKLLSLTVPPEKLVPVAREHAVPSPLAPGEQVAAALERPYGFGPLRTAITPDDRNAIVLDETLPHLAELLAGILAHLATAGIPPAAVTILSPAGSSSSWIDDLPDEYADVRTESHDPADRKKLAYLATTQAGRLVYLNRTLAESEFTIILSGRDYDPYFGRGGAEALLFPGLADTEGQQIPAGRFRFDFDDEPTVARAEAVEVGWLLGTPFLVQVIHAEGVVREVVAGLQNSAAEGERRHDAHWRGTLNARPDAAIASVAGTSFAALAAAAACAARVVEEGGRIALIAEGDAYPVLAIHEDVDTAREELPTDPAAFLWLTAATRCRLFLGGKAAASAEGLFAVPLTSDTELQRLADAATKLVVIPDADRTLLTIQEPA